MTVSIVGFDTKTSKFPGGELHFEIVEPKLAFKQFKTSGSFQVLIKCDFNSNDDLFLIAMAADAARKLFKPKDLVLNIPYFPYARQDRYTALGTSFSLKIATDFINSIKFDHVVIADAHSVVLPTLLNNVWETPFYEGLVGKYLDKLTNEERKKVIVLSPDAGAVKRSKRIAEIFDLGFAIADKKREPSTGKILSTNIYGNIQDDSIIVIVDDICDGGRTFTELAKTLKASYNSVRINLFVTFGIFSKGMSVFNDFETVDALHKFWSIE